MSANNTSSAPQGVQGAGQWKTGTTVREIEGHFHKENEPSNVQPISKDGGVPGVDYAAQKLEQAKDKVSGHHQQKQ